MEIFEKSAERSGLTRTICEAPVDPEEGGISGFFGFAPVTFCAWCHAAMVELVSQGCPQCGIDDDTAEPTLN